MKKPQDNPFYFIFHDGVKHAMGKDCSVCEQILSQKLREFARIGGMSKLNRYGKSAFSKMGKVGSKRVRELYGPEYYTKLSAAGVTARNKKRKIKELEE